MMRHVGLALASLIVGLWATSASADQLKIDGWQDHGLAYKSVICNSLEQTEQFVGTVRPQWTRAQAIVEVNKHNGKGACAQQSVAFSHIKIKKTVVNELGVFRLVECRIDAVYHFGHWVKITPRVRWGYYLVPTIQV